MPHTGEQLFESVNLISPRVFVVHFYEACFLNLQRPSRSFPLWREERERRERREGERRERREGEKCESGEGRRQGEEERRASWNISAELN